MKLPSNILLEAVYAVKKDLGLGLIVLIEVVQNSTIILF
jgi:hypothetical protein